MIFLHYEGDYSARAFTLNYEESTVESLRITGTYRGSYHAGSSGDDVILAFGGNDSVHGGAGADHINGGLGQDFLKGGNGSDLIIGNDGNDRLIGGAGLDRVCGGSGRDILDGGYGEDVLSGGAGRDEFVFRLGEGTDRITDFEIGVDSLRFQFDGYVNMHQGLTEDGLTIIFEGITVFLAGVDSFVAMDHFILT